MKLWVEKYLSFLAGLLAGYQAGQFVHGALRATFWFTVGDTEVFYMGLVDRAAEGGLSVVQFWTYYDVILVGFGLVASVIVFRWVAVIGWRCRMQLRQTALCWFLLMGLSLLLHWIESEGVINPDQAQVILIIVVLTLGFALHVWFQRAAEKKVRESTNRERANAFA